ncbi:MAG: hypothetical protein J6R40_03430, partial [Clostridia bacterium]|nr:hypothetical protein [Clostridia bacterium]
MKRFLREAVYRLTAKRVDEDALEAVVIRLRENDISYFNLSTNPILSFCHEGKLYYFRECFSLEKKEAYLRAAVASFFHTIHRQGIAKEHFCQEIPLRLHFSDDEVARFKDYIDAKMASGAFVKTLSRTDETAQRLGFSIGGSMDYDASFFDSFALHDLDKTLYDIALFFLWYMRSAALQYKMLKIARGKKRSYFNAVRAVSSRIVAEELGCERLITNLSFCRLTLDSGRSLFGVLSDTADGERMADTDVAPSGSLQRELLILNALDVICHQPDHAPNNYNLKVLSDSLTVCAFDNDNPRTFFPLTAIHLSLSSCAPLADKAGTMLRPYFPKAFAESLQRVDTKRLTKRLKPYLNSLQICCTLT